LEILQKAKRTCSCEYYGRRHYHELVFSDVESGNEYSETSEVRHRKFLERLGRDLRWLKDRMKRIKRKRANGRRESTAKAETVRLL
jgi:hypothetical protein